jgi:hypothetical protein
MTELQPFAQDNAGLVFDTIPSAFRTAFTSSQCKHDSSLTIADCD